MSKKVIFPLIAVFGLSVGVGVGAVGCHAEAHVGEAKAASAEPPPPPPPPATSSAPAPAPPPQEKPIKTTGKAKIENGHIKIPGKIHFDTDKATLKDDKETKEILETVANVLKENAQITKVRIEGNTDDSGSHDHNMKLSQDRAETVSKWLQDKGGIDKARLDPKGWGPDRYLVKNDSAEHKEQNRRVDFKIWEIDGKPTDLAKNDDKWTPPAGAAPAAASATPAAAAPKK